MLKKDEIKSYSWISFGTLLMAVGIYFFKFPNNFLTGGISSLSIILASVLPRFTRAEYMFVFNVILLIVGFAVFGRKFAFKTVYCSLLLSVLTRMFEVIIPLNEPITNQKLLELFFAIGINSVGNAIIFNEQGSSGGTDIVAMILKKYTNQDIGKSLLFSDFLLVVLGFFVFDATTALFSAFGLVMRAFVVDNIIDGINLTKCFMIITTKPDEICRFINEELHRGATTTSCIGSFTGEKRTLILTVLKRNQAILLKRYIKKIDQHAFSTITNSSDILGRGFRMIL